MGLPCADGTKESVAGLERGPNCSSIGAASEPVLVQTVDLTREYRRGTQTIRALDGLNLSIGVGEFLCLTGSSGSGTASK